MTLRSQLQTVAIVTVVFLASVFAFTSFTAAEHRTDISTQVVTSSTNGASMTSPSTIHLSVVGADPIRGQVASALVAALDERGVDAQIVTDLAPTYDHPVLLVAVTESQLAYNPISPSATVSLHFKYAADGNVTQFGQTHPGATFDATLLEKRLLNGDSISVVLDDENTLFRSGDIHVTDASTGLLSWPGYRGHVLDTAGTAVIESLLTGGL